MKIEFTDRVHVRHNTMSTSESGMNAQQWVKDQLYKELITMPVWTMAAFGSLKEGDVLTTTDTRYKLILYLVTQHMRNVPLDLYDSVYRHTWKVSDFKDTIKNAVKFIQTGFEN